MDVRGDFMVTWAPTTTAVAVLETLLKVKLLNKKQGTTGPTFSSFFLLVGSGYHLVRKKPCDSRVTLKLPKSQEKARKRDKKKRRPFVSKIH